MNHHSVEELIVIPLAYCINGQSLKRQDTPNRHQYSMYFSKPKTADRHKISNNVYRTGFPAQKSRSGKCPQFISMVGTYYSDPKAINTCAGSLHKPLRNLWQPCQICLAGSGDIQCRPQHRPVGIYKLLAVVVPSHGAECGLQPLENATNTNNTTSFTTSPCQRR